MQSLTLSEKLTYTIAENWGDLNELFNYIKDNPYSNKTYFEIHKHIELLRKNGKTKIKGIAVKYKPIEIQGYTLHAYEQMKHRSITSKDAQRFIDNNILAFKQRNGSQYAYYSSEGFTAISTKGIILSVGTLDNAGKLLITDVNLIKSNSYIYSSNKK